MVTIRRLAPTLTAASHLHDFHEFVYVLQGSYQIHARHKTYQLPIGGSACIPAGLEHKPTYDQEFTCFLIQWRHQDELNQAVEVVGYPMIGYDYNGLLKQNLQQMLSWSYNSMVPHRDIIAMLQVVLRQHSNIEEESFRN